MEYSTNIYSYIKSEEQNFLLPVPIGDDLEWSMKEHIKTSFFYKNGKLLTGNSDDKPVKNIVLPIRNLQDRAEGFDVKDIVLFLNSKVKYFKSFLVRKFHDKWARENSIDTFIDDLVETEGDYGGVLVKNVNKVRPEVVPFQSIVFCDQTDILSGPIGIKHFYSPDQLKEMEEFGWGNKEKGATATIDEVIVLSQNYKVQNDQSKQQTKTPGKYIEVYEVHGTFPETFLKEDGNIEKYSKQLHIVCYYTDENGKEQGITLFKGIEKESPFKFKKRTNYFGRALGMGGVEELFEPQVWVNYSMIRKKEMLDAACKVILKTTDPAVSARHPSGLKDLDNLEIIELEEGKDIGQLDTTPRSMTLFNNWTLELESYAQRTGGATDALLGENPSSGTPFKLQDVVIQQGQGLHEYRKGKMATFVGEIYRDWIIPYIAKEISKGQEFLATLDMEELQMVAESLVICRANNFIKEKILNGEMINETELESYKQRVRDEFMKGGNKKFIEIFKDEIKNIPIDVEVNIVGKQKNLNAMTDKLVNIFRQIIASPQVLDDPRMAKIWNQILEYSGFSPIDFNQSGYKAPQQTQQQIQGQSQNQEQLTTI